MIFLLLGEDSFQIKQKKQEIIEKFSKEFSKKILIKSFNLSETPFKKDEVIFNNSSIFGERKIFVFENIDRNSEFQNFFLKNLTSYKNSQEIFILIQEGKPKNKEFFEKIKQNSSEYFEFNFLSKSEFLKWVKKNLKKYSLRFTPKAMEIFLERCEMDLWRVENELKKLSLFQEEKNLITEKEVIKLVPLNLKENIFLFVNAIFSKDIKKASSILREYLFEGERLNFLFSILKTQVRDLIFSRSLLERSPILAQKILLKKFHPFRARILLENAKKFNLAFLKRVYFKIFELELRVKKGELSFPTLFSILGLS